jgi:hypothetical protein
MGEPQGAFTFALFHAMGPQVLAPQVLGEAS